MNKAPIDMTPEQFQQHLTELDHWEQKNKEYNQSQTESDDE